MFIVDAHQDLAWNMMSFGRDYTRSAAETRRLEAGTPAVAYNGDSLLGYPDYLRGRVALIFAVLFAAPQRFRAGVWEAVYYQDAQQARQVYQAQFDLYERLVDEHPDQFRLVRSQADLSNTLQQWERFVAQQQADASSEDGLQAGQALPQEHPAVGLVITMEGAEGVREPGELDEWWQRGLRLIGPAWCGTRFCGGMREPGPMTTEGYALLERMAEVGFGLDLTHMDEQAVLQALDVYPGQVIASHSNALALLPGIGGNRHLSDRVIQGIVERDGVIGLVPLNSFLKAGWKLGDPRDAVQLELLAAQIDYICQIAGDAYHVGLGTDFDGGFGVQSAPAGVDTIADLNKLPPLLTRRGYSDHDLVAIMGENWLARLRRILPEAI